MRRNASQAMDLTSCTWMVRELGEAVSCTVLLDDDSLLVGGWDGTIKHWTEAGDLVWEAKTPNRISSMVVKDGSESVFSPAAFMSAVVVGSGTDPDATAARYDQKGNIFIGTDENIWIYS